MVWSAAKCAVYSLWHGARLSYLHESGNANKRKSFERVEILFDRVKYARHLRLDETIVKANVGTRICFEFYDLKLNTHLQDSTLIRWIE